jgi:hypothetical protein
LLEFAGHLEGLPLIWVRQVTHCRISPKTPRRDWRNDGLDGCPERVRSSLQALTDLG